MERRYRIKANIGEDSVLNVNFKQDVDLYEILSLNIAKDDFEKLKRNNAYKLFSSDYGVIVGRVLANDAFGVPNAKVSVFIPLSKEDELRTDIKNTYPYSFVTDYNKDNIRFNTLPNYSVSECHTPVGTFPSKRLVLDNDTVLEIYDKYYKYTTITNNAGDYMIFGVPVGEQIIHTDIDLSDIGVLSQIPSDFLSKGYTIDMFESPSKFKHSTNLDNLAQVFSENTSVNVYPFWGDKSTNEIAITRKDIRLQYKFETTCVFLGSVITDSPNNSVNHTCEPDVKMGEAYQLTTSDGTIEMIRKTVDDVVEEYNINGNRLIDSDGVFCYQIPMNLDFVGTDEYGNIVPTDNPKKGIATRARVRFRITLNESGSDALTTHKARYLVPNNPDLLDDSITPQVDGSVFNGNEYYEFGTLTPDECFRDLYWNKVYSVKNYIPRIQKNKYDREQHYLALKGVNKREAANINPFPFNKLNLNITIPAYQLLDTLKEIGEHSPIRVFWKFLRGNYVPYQIDNLFETIVDETDAIGLDFYNDWLNGCLYFPNWYMYLRKQNDVNVEKRRETKNKQKYNSDLCECKRKVDGETDANSNSLYVVNNCSLAYRNEELDINFDYHESENEEEDKERVTPKFINMSTLGSLKISSGIIKKIVNKDNAEIFYYAFGDKAGNDKVSNYYNRRGGQRSTTITSSNCTANNIGVEAKNIPSKLGIEETTVKFGVTSSSVETYEPDSYVRLFSTDIILLGSLKDNDIHSIPKINNNFPITTSHIPSIGEYKTGKSDEIDEGDKEANYTSYNGMNWGTYWFKEQHDLVGKYKDNDYVTSDAQYYLGTGLFFGLSAFQLIQKDSGGWFSWFITFLTGIPVVLMGMESKTTYLQALCDYKTVPNSERISELGVSFDSDYKVKLQKNSTCSNLLVSKDGLITSKEIMDNDTRALFASLNSNKMIGYPDRKINGYNSYKLSYLYPTSFDGRLRVIAPEYTFDDTEDDRCKDYLDFRFNTIFKKQKHFYGYNAKEGIYAFPLYENSFYFYFGLNPGKTAIEKFYNNYMGKCIKESEKLAFSFSTAPTPTQSCKNNGQIDITFDTAIATPYKIELYDSYNKLIESTDKDQYSSEYHFTDLYSGRYTIVVTDAYDAVVTVEETIESDTVSIKCEAIRQIGYNGPDESIKCDYGNYGVIAIKSYNLGGKEEEITNLPQPDTSNSNVYEFELDYVTIRFESQTGDNLEDCICTVSETEIVSGNEIRIKAPNTYIISIAENGCDINSDSTVVSMTTGKSIEMGVNGVELNYLIDENNSLNKTIFYDPTKTQDNNYVVEDVKGFFGVHGPDVYLSGFNNEAENTSVDVSIVKKLKYMFGMSNSTYVESTNRNNILTINIDEGDSLIRCSYPKYDGSSWMNDDDYTTTNNTHTITGNNKFPNIVSNNYVYGNGTTVSGNYEFNKKYKGDDAKIYAGNYFACFANYAEIRNLGNDCYRDDNYSPFNKIPTNSDDLYTYNGKFCPTATLNTIPESVYSRTGDYKPYFRTEFIDRRFDYDLVFVTPTKYGTTIEDWNCARLSGETFNGIEMAYTDENKIIVSSNDTTDNTEYKFDKNTGVITLSNGKKRFYDSKIVIGNKTYQIEDLYYSNLSTPTSPEGNIIKVVSHDDSEFTSDVYKNFGLINGEIVGYPTTRRIDLDIKEYGDNYTYSVTNCSYDIDNVTVNTAAKAGETTSCDLSVLSNILDSENIPGIKCEDISVSGPVNPLTFEAYFSTEFAAEARENGYKYKIILDNAQHTEYKKLRTATTVNFNELITESFPSDTPCKVSLGNIGGYPYVGILIKKVIEGDGNNLTKRITLVDASTFYKINSFTCAVSKVRVTNNARTDIPSTSVSTEGTGTITIGDETYTVHVTSRGSTDPTEGTAHVTGDIFKIIFAGNNLNVDSVQCTLYRSASSAIGTYTAVYSREENAYFVSSNEEPSGHVIKMLIYVKVDGLVYYFNVNNLNG